MANQLYELIAEKCKSMNGEPISIFAGRVTEHISEFMVIWKRPNSFSGWEYIAHRCYIQNNEVVFESGFYTDNLDAAIEDANRRTGYAQAV